jgi:RNA polymerase sigma-70 factor (ECF subfamily)
MGRLTALLSEHMAGACTEDVDEALSRSWQTGRAALPELEVTCESFVRHLAPHVAGEQIAESLAKLHAAEFYLACACAAGQPAALAVFEERYLSHVGMFLGRMKPQPAFVDEVRQVLRDKLFVGPKPKILEYSGRGELNNWLRVVTTRTALNLQRRRMEILDNGSSSPSRQVPASPQSDPELGYIKERYRAAFQAALSASVASLSQEQRNLLRLHFMQGVTLDELATLFHVHRTTIARRIAQTRDAILQQMRDQLEAQLRVDSSELASLMGLMRSQIDLSISRLLHSITP